MGMGEHGPGRDSRGKKTSAARWCSGALVDLLLLLKQGPCSQRYPLRQRALHARPSWRPASPRGPTGRPSCPLAPRSCPLGSAAANGDCGVPVRGGGVGQRAPSWTGQRARARRIGCPLQERGYCGSIPKELFGPASLMAPPAATALHAIPRPLGRFPAAVVVRAAAVSGEGQAALGRRALLASTALVVSIAG